MMKNGNYLRVAFYSELYAKLDIFQNKTGRDFRKVGLMLVSQ